jgi:hypothetical protein
MKRAALAAAVVAAASAVGWRQVLGPWQQRWGATDDEVVMALPGDERVAEPAAQATRAVTIEAPPEAVWPWVAQLGADRGGFYSYERLENLFGLGIHNSDVIVPEWQERAVGDLVFADAKGSGGWYVVDVVPGEALVLSVGDVKAGRPVRRDEQLGWEFGWTFVVRAASGGRSRLIVRERTGFGSRLTELAMAPIGVVSFVMTQKMLRGIKERAEAVTRPATCAPRSR